MPADRLFIAEYGVSAPFGAYDRATLAFGENGAPTTDLEGQAGWLGQCLCVLRAVGINKSAYWTLYDAASLWSSSTWSLSRREVSLIGHWGLAFEDMARGFKPAWIALRDFHSGKPLSCGELRTAVVDAARGPVRWTDRQPVRAARDPATPAAQAEAIDVQAVVSAASFRPGAWYPGSLLSLFVSGLRDFPPLWSAAGYPLPTSQFGLQVEFQGGPNEAARKGALLAVAANPRQQQINVQVPWELITVQSLSVSQGGAPSLRVNNNPRGNWGEFFLDARGNALALHEDTGALVTPENPARSSEAVLLYLTNLPYRPRVVPPTGQPIDASRPASDHTVSVENRTSRSEYRIVADGIDFAAGGAISYIRLAPYYVGLYQMRLVVPMVQTPQTISVYYRECLYYHGFPCLGGSFRRSQTTLPVAPPR